MLVLMTMLMLVSALFIPDIRVSSSQKALLPADNPLQMRYQAFMDEFGLADSIIVVLEGETEVLKSSADLFVVELKKENEWLSSVFYKNDIDFFIKKAPLFIPLTDLEKGLEALEKNFTLFEQAGRINNLYDMLSAMREGIENPGMASNPEVQQFALNGMTVIFKAWNQWLTDPGKTDISAIDSFVAPGSEAGNMLKSGGYLFSRDFHMLFIKVQPVKADDEIDYLRPLIDHIRTACDRVFEDYPGLRGKVKVSLTGMPAHVLTETETVFSDVGRAGVLASILVVLILLFGFASIRKTILSVIPLVYGMVITLGVVSLTLGKLNLISSAFFAVLFGLGIDFSIYFIRRTEEELGNGRELSLAVYLAVVNTGRSVLSGGVTTGFAFLAISLSDFSGYSELGLTAGMGILIVLFCTLLMMPALLLNFPIEKRHYTIVDDDKAAANPRRRAALWVITVVTVAFVAFGIFAASQIKMDYNVLSLLPKDTESTIYQIEMEERSDFKMTFAAATAPDLEAIRTIADTVMQLPEVSRVESLASVIPADQKEKLKIVARYRDYLQNFRMPHIAALHSQQDYTAIFDELLPFFENAQEDAFAAGRGDLVGLLDELITAMDQVQANLAQPSEEKKAYALNRTRDFETALFASITRLTGIIHHWLNLEEITEDNLPPEILGQLKSKAGNYAALIYPVGSIWDIAVLDRFVTQLEKHTTNLTGFPVTHRFFVRQAASAVIQAVIYSLVMILIVLALDLKRVKAVLFALVPLVVGMLWMQGVLYVLGISYNVANIAALPLLLGLSVVYGLHIVHRWQESPEHSAFVSTHTDGRAVAFAAFTTICGLGSIIFARHQGVATFGILLFAGIMLAMITALYVLPALIDLAYFKRINGGNNENSL